MPNTLIHLAAQPALTPAAWRVRDTWTLHLALLGAALPDTPWILQRIVRRAYQTLAPTPGPNGDPVFAEFRLYFGVQSSLGFCLLLALSVALLTRRPLPAFATLGTGSVLHLLLDGLQVKWANGVLWWVPFNWKLQRFDLVWPESGWNDIATGLSCIVLILLCWRLWSSPPREPLLYPRRWIAATLALLVWFAAPFALTDNLRNADAYSIESLAAPASGQAVALGTASVFETNGELWVRTLTERHLPLRGIAPDALDETSRVGKYSLKGHLVTETAPSAAKRVVLEVSDWHRHRLATRETFTAAGLLLLGLILVGQHWRATRTPNRGPHQP